MENSALSNVRRGRPDCTLMFNFTVTESMKTTWVSLMAVTCIAFLPTIILNVLVVWSILEKKSLRARIYHLVLSLLACTDLIIGSVGYPITVVQHWVCLTQQCKMPCILTRIVPLAVMICYFMSLCTITVAAFERYLAIEHPFFYQRSVNGTRVAIGTVSSWAVTLTILMTTRQLWVGSTLRMLPMIVNVGVYIIAILYCTIRVHMTSYRQRRRTINAHDQVNTIQQQGETAAQQKRKRQLQNYKLAFTTSILVLVNVVFYFSLFISLIIETIDKAGVENRTSDLENTVEHGIRTFTFLQALVNPIIISMRMSGIRQGVKNKLMCRRNTTDNAIHGGNIDMNLRRNIAKEKPNVACS